MIGRRHTDGQHQGVDIPAYASTAHNGLRQKRLEEDIYLIVCLVPLTTPSVKRLSWIELNWTIHVQFLSSPTLGPWPVELLSLLTLSSSSRIGKGFVLKRWYSLLRQLRSVVCHSLVLPRRTFFIITFVFLILSCSIIFILQLSSILSFLLNSSLLSFLFFFSLLNYLLTLILLARLTGRWKNLLIISCFLFLRARLSFPLSLPLSLSPSLYLPLVLRWTCVVVRTLKSNETQFFFVCLFVFVLFFLNPNKAGRCAHRRSCSIKKRHSFFTFCAFWFSSRTSAVKFCFRLLIENTDCWKQKKG